MVKNKKNLMWIPFFYLLVFFYACGGGGSSSEPGSPDSPEINGIEEGAYNTDRMFSITGDTGAEIDYSLDGGTTWMVYLHEVTLSDEGVYHITARQTLSGRISVNAETVSVTIDKTPPDIMTGLTMDTDSGSVTLGWTEPDDEDYAGVRITFTPEISEITQPIDVLKGTTSVTLSPLTKGTEYSFSLTTFDTLGNESTTETLTITPRSDNADLSGLTIYSNYTLKPQFSSSIVSYSEAVTTAATHIYVKPIAFDADYSKIEVKVNGDAWMSVVSGNQSAPLNLNTGDNTILIKVTAANGMDEKTYTVNFKYLDDTDHDFIADTYESGDSDGDSIPDVEDDDDDGDGVPTAIECIDPYWSLSPQGARDTDCDGKPDYLEPDDDGDGLSTQNEISYDDDDDGVNNAYESCLRDLDNDSLVDSLDNDDDGDGILTLLEIGSDDDNKNGIPDYYEPDYY